MFTFITGLALHPARAFARYGGLREFAATPYGWKIFFGGMLGSVMWANVWFVIWPGQQVVMAPPSRWRPAAGHSRGGRARARAAGVASRTNTLLSIPMLFFMGAASHLAMANPMSAARSGAR